MAKIERRVEENGKQVFNHQTETKTSRAHRDTDQTRGGKTSTKTKTKNKHTRTLLLQKSKHYGSVMFWFSRQRRSESIPRLSTLLLILQRSKHTQKYRNKQWNRSLWNIFSFLVLSQRFPKNHGMIFRWKTLEIGKQFEVHRLIWPGFSQCKDQIKSKQSSQRCTVAFYWQSLSYFIKSCKTY